MLKYLLIKPKKIFECLIESDFILSCLMFLFKMHFCVFLQKLVQRLSRKKLATQSFLQKGLKGNKLFHLVTQKLSLLYCDYLAINSFLRNVVWLKLDFSKFRQKLPLLSCDLQAKVFVLQRSLSRVPRNYEKHMFSVLYSRCDSFSNT